MSLSTQAGLTNSMSELVFISCSKGGETTQKKEIVSQGL